MNARIALAVTALFSTAALGNAPAGKPAPAFTVTDLDGKTVNLADYKGKTVVLEWTNFGCPFVQKHYRSGNMPSTRGDAMGDTIRTEPACFHQRARVPPIRLRAARSRGVHRCEVRIRDDDLMAQALEVPRDPLTLGARLQLDLRPWPRPEHGGEGVRDSRR